MYKNLWREKKVHKFLYFLFAKKLFSYFFIPKKCVIREIGEIFNLQFKEILFFVL